MLTKSSYLLLSLLLIPVIGFVSSCSNDPSPEIRSLKDKTIVQPYEREQEIEFPHAAHEQVDCKFCHHPEIDGKTGGVPAMSVCMKCHKQINGNQPQDSVQN